MVEDKRTPTLAEVVELVPEKINGNFKGKDILSMEQFDLASIDRLFKVTREMSETAKNARPPQILSGNTIALVFCEPSSRTRLSFDAATKKLGGQTITFNEDPQQFSPVVDRKVFEAKIQTIEVLCNTIVLRHPEKDSAQKAADVAFHVPVINAGDGGKSHPTQALGDLYTIQEKKGTLSGLKGVLARDLKYSRTVHSLLEGLSLYPNNTIYLLSQEELKLERRYVEKFRNSGLKIIEIEDESNLPKVCDFWYWTRIQRERFEDDQLKDYGKLNDHYIMDADFVKKHGNENLIIMHPLPRIEEIAIDVDKDPRSVYLKNQVRNGMYIRMALLALVLGKIK